MNFDRDKHTLKATRDFSRGPLRKKKGEALSAAEMASVDDGDVALLVDVSKVAEIVGANTAAAKEANAGDAGTVDKVAGQASTGKMD